MRYWITRSFQAVLLVGLPCKRRRKTQTKPHWYEPVPLAQTFRAFLASQERLKKTACFWGPTRSAWDGLTSAVLMLPIMLQCIALTLLPVDYCLLLSEHFLTVLCLLLAVVSQIGKGTFDSMSALLDLGVCVLSTFTVKQSLLCFFPQVFFTLCWGRGLRSCVLLHSRAAVLNFLNAATLEYRPSCCGDHQT